MSLSKFLKDQGYDLIQGPVRNHQPLQLWLKRIFNEAELYYKHVQHAFQSEVVLEAVKNPALQVDSTQKDAFSFHIGITLLDQLLESIGLGEFGLTGKIQSGKKVSIGYDQSFTREYPLGNLESYFHTADFLHPNPSLLRNANRNDILLISGVLFAQHIAVEVETDFSLKAEFVAELNQMAKGALEFSKEGEDKLQMHSQGNLVFPVAVKAHKLDFDHHIFDRLKLITDNRNFF